MPVNKRDVVRTVNAGAGSGTDQDVLLALAGEKPGLWDGLEEDDVLGVLKQASSNSGADDIDKLRGELKGLKLQQQQMEQQQQQIEARASKEIAQLLRSITTAVDIGKDIKTSPACNDSLSQKEQLFSKLDASEGKVTELMAAILKELPDTIEECVQLQTLREQSSGTKRKRPPANKSSSSVALPESSSSQPPSRALTEAEVQKGWGYLLKQLQQAGKQHVEWHLHDTSKSGITEPGSKLDYCFAALSTKA